MITEMNGGVMVKTLCLKLAHSNGHGLTHKEKEYSSGALIAVQRDATASA